MILFHSEKIAHYEIRVILPSGYDSTKQYRTIYMHDGGDTAIQCVDYIDHLIISGQIEPLIIIGIEPNDRHNDYTPWAAPSLAPHTPMFGGQAKAYLQTVVTKIKPYIDAHYATNPAPSHTAISGCSFGGLVSIFASYYYPEVFHQYISLSASFWYKDVLQFIQGKQVNRQEHTYIKPTVNRENHQLYLYVGELEGIYKDTIQAHMVDYTKKAHREFIEEGYLESKLLFELNPEGTHDDLFFSKYFIRALHWLYENKS
ncbi:alpha/beta hydrolase [Bacillus norwichensis]|uniref:Alpha/beta hydrolase n=1 Tax=Bacillus norwichensis TaxID=2762217 RepID=A0ABR8VPB8_9BACI|nr:alpha/beta hydrolase-fold protein [Bacillus norwichensis]MBD8006276.1 alpha/beta hydrolase [Bacillus norwichensis]